MAKLALWRHQLQQQLLIQLGETAGGLALSLVFGTQSHLQAHFKQSFETTGTLHILAVSGLHVSLLMGVMGSVTSAVVSGKQKATLLFILVSIYVLLVGFKPSILRAWGMISFALFARYWLFRQYHAFYTLLVVAIILLAVRPDWLLHPGWQLSVAGTASILLFARRFTQLVGSIVMLPDITGFSAAQTWNPFQIWKQSLGISLAAQIATLPLVLYHFGSVPLLGFIPGSVLTPIAGLVLHALFVLISGQLLLGVISASLTQELSKITSVLLEVFASVVGWFAGYDWWFFEL